MYLHTFRVTIRLVSNFFMNLIIVITNERSYFWISTLTKIECYQYSPPIRLNIIQKIILCLWSEVQINYLNFKGEKFYAELISDFSYSINTIEHRYIIFSLDKKISQLQKFFFQTPIISGCKYLPTKIWAKRNPFHPIQLIYLF